MQDLGTADYGSWYEVTIPEPDSPLTVDWGSCIAKNVAKITKAFVVIGTTPVGSMGTYEITATRANFTDFPFTKIYHMLNSDNIYWTDYQFIGTGNSVVSNADITTFDIDRIAPGTSRVLIGTHSDIANPVRWNLIQYGR